MSNQKLLFMAQKQKLKSERGRLNEGIKDMFMTMDPKAFREAIKQLADLRETSKPNFNFVLERFQELKTAKPQAYSVKDVIMKRFIRGNEELNYLLSILLSTYWTCQDKYDGGYFWCMIPNEKKDNENIDDFLNRISLMGENLMQVMLGVLEDCDYYIKGTQNAQKPQN